MLYFTTGEIFVYLRLIITYCFTLPRLVFATVMKKSPCNQFPRVFRLKFFRTEINRCAWNYSYAIAVALRIFMKKNQASSFLCPPFFFRVACFEDQTCDDVLKFNCTETSHELKNRQYYLWFKIKKFQVAQMLIYRYQVAIMFRESTY